MYTTWDQWAKTSGPPRESLIAASFAAGLGHREPGNADTITRVTSTLAHGRLLLVVDSLDEAADLPHQRGRLYELSALTGCRVVVTSRPTAWHLTYGGLARSGRQRVAELQNLAYPRDVESFISAWYAGEPGRAMARAVHRACPAAAAA